MPQPHPVADEGTSAPPHESLLLRPLYLPGAHLPDSAGPVWTCRTCTTPWPCPTAQPYLRAGQCSTRSETTQWKSCGATIQWERNGPRHWHVGPDCYTHKDVLAALAEELHQQHMANPHYPPSHFYPEKPRRRRRQRPPYKHTPMGPGDIKPGTWLWVIPGGLHPGWGDIHRLAMLTALGTPYCEVWMDDTTVHRVRPEKLILSDAGRQAAHAAGLATIREATGPRPRPLLPEWQWVDWTLAEHIAHQQQTAPTVEPTGQPIQDELFTVA
ncbi:hypothetical protein ACPCTN_33410 [Streptomyces cinereoruber]|uniref:hypothetical protein n=1 Tax=Streptomyces cinereoruber TaxID=67260 RepID=UPI003C2EEC5E